MTILGPLVAPSTSTVTPALSRPEAVTFSPSTTITTGRVSDSPTPVSTLSISMTSPTATFCCLLPARTTAYTAGSLSLDWRMPEKLDMKTMGARQHTEDQLYWLPGGGVKTRPSAGSDAQRLREPLRLIGTCTSDRPSESSSDCGESSSG